LKKVFQFRFDGEACIGGAADELVTGWGSAVAGEAVEAWRQRDGVKNEDSVDVGVLDWRGGK
jgi:hypothetical protein